MHHTFFHNDGKFWGIQSDGKTTITTYGKMGGSQRTLTKYHVSKTKAEDYVSNQIKSKLRKGYFQDGEKLDKKSKEKNETFEN